MNSPAFDLIVSMLDNLSPVQKLELKLLLEDQIRLDEEASKNAVESNHQRERKSN